MWLSDEQQHVWRNYLTMVGRLQVAMHRRLQDDCGLSLADYDVLVALDERCPIRVGELGDVLGWEQSRLSHQLRRMRERGLLTREGRADDRRGANVDLTDGGRAALAAAAPGHAELVRSVVFDGMGTQELRALASLTERVLGRLG
ncbi:MarR family winged helix-turn-helix transcriptional regulator [Mycolicibacterium komossense]|uniref:Winged helix-turn-helix transcriptional regulator n=1 Tax=Mycolicibacterium komossense TaxID=1779 RepID=A0ABT3C8A5_9MYCO|nr:MarR family winged helix-turn-helix transcriptional regulator [Mycolicibacterium komossense]MCV7225719.1 winged helix-turn-helix transcriptional regulator [Mycolicibacterium komossense]